LVSIYEDERGYDRELGHEEDHDNEEDHATKKKTTLSQQVRLHAEGTTRRQLASRHVETFQSACPATPLSPKL
jgi:hypothetical protein